MIKDFNKIVNKLLKKWWNVVFKKDIFDIIDPENKPEYVNGVNKIIYRLKAAGHIISLKAWVYIVPDEEDGKLNSVDLIDKYYLKLLKKYIIKEVWSEYYISGAKSLAFHLKDMSIPHKKKINLYGKVSEYKKDIKLESIDFKICALEITLLEAALVWDIYEWLDTSLLVRAIKKYARVLDPEIFHEAFPRYYQKKLKLFCRRGIKRDVIWLLFYKNYSCII